MTPTDRQLWRANRRVLQRAAKHRALLDETLPNPFIAPVKKAKPAAKKAVRRRK